MTSATPHILMITNHGIHQWQVIPGLPDTGGQNIFVNQFSDALAQLGYRITIVNRGGFPHPVTGTPRRGYHVKDERQRILYLEDGLAEFVRKEDMAARLPALAEALAASLDSPVDLILSHYWDGALLGALFNKKLARPVRHIWTPHSLGAIKKRNVEPERWAGLRIDERIAIERSLISRLDGIAATSSTIRRSLREDYGYTGSPLFLPPCVDIGRYFPRTVPADDPVWAFLGRLAGLPPHEVRTRKIITEISRTDTTKRKDVLIRAFAKASQQAPNSLLVLSIDDSQAALAQALRSLIRDLGLTNRVAVVGSVWELLPTLYAISAIYCTPSVMEGFGMSAQEAAASRVPIIASHRVPFATEYLLGAAPEIVRLDDNGRTLQVGQAAIVAQAGDVDSFARALTMLLADDNLRSRMGEQAYRLTVPYFTWPHRVSAFLDEISILPRPHEPAD